MAKRLSQKKFLELADQVAEKKMYYEWVSKIDGSRIAAFLSDDPDKTLKELFKRGITEQIQALYKGGSVAQIGFNPTEQAWYGWSHRAIAKFKIGHVVRKNDSREKIPVGFRCRTLSDCKKVAKDFADSVS